jgi:hypothetical protein
MAENGAIKLTMMIALMMEENKRQVFLGERKYFFIVTSERLHYYWRQI